MASPAPLILELQEVIAAGTTERRVDALRRVTDLFLYDASRCGEDIVAVFDDVIGLLAQRIEARARVELAERLAPVPNAPPGVIRTLAHDDVIAVARPVITQSPRLTDRDLVSVARNKGQDHMLALSERRNIPAAVTDVLIDRGGPQVVRSVARNSTARLSRRGVDALVRQSQGDEELRGALEGRRDLPPEQLEKLVEMAKQAARARLVGSVGAAGSAALDLAIEHGAEEVAVQARAALVPRKLEEARARIAELVEKRPLTEHDVIAFAKQRQREECVCALAHMANLPLAVGERLFTSGENDLLLIVCRSLGFSWSATRELLVVRHGEPMPNHLLHSLLGNFEELSVSTAQRVLRFLHVRETATSG